MRWTRAALLLVLPLSACIYYEGECDGDCNDWNDWCDWDDGWCDDDPNDPNDTADADDTDAQDDTGDDCLIQLDMSLEPGEAEQGTGLIAVLTTAEGEDLSTVVGAEFTTGVTINAFLARPDEVIFCLSVAPDAEIGLVDLFLDFEDGTIAFGDDVFNILEATEPPTGEDEDPCG